MNKFTTDARTVQALIYSALADFSNFCVHLQAPDPRSVLEKFVIGRGLPIFERETASWFDRINAMQVADPAPELDGEGLPPVGAHVVVHDADGTLMYGHGESGEVLAHIENTAVIRMSYGLGCFTARNLRTPEQIADDDRAKAAIGMAMDIGGVESLRDKEILNALASAGYRKQVAE